MKRIILIVFFFELFFTGMLLAQTYDSGDIINKNNGRIILAYKAFERFLNSDHTWQVYKHIVLDACPEMLAVHKKTLSWGTIDSINFPLSVTAYKKQDWEKYFSRYDMNTLNYLYDSLLVRADNILKPLNHNPVDLCLFLPYGGCFIIPGPARSTIYISLLIDPNDVQKIMIHEYSHNLHIQRRPVESLTLHREIVSEGMAVYLTTKILRTDIYKAIPFMPEKNVGWCFENEKLIKTALIPELSDTTFNGLKKFIADGSISTPPAGFVEKTGYFAGYRIIEACINKGMKLEDICSLNSDSVIARSGYFGKSR